MILLDSYLEDIRSVAIAGHIRPDGDCVGSCLAVYNYIRDFYPDLEAAVYLEPIPEKFGFLKNADQIRHPGRQDVQQEYDLFIALDCSDLGRLGEAAGYFEVAKSTFCVDHHISNQSFADFNYIFPNASSTSELVYQLLDTDRITKEIAECIYLGIAHDTGVFRYSCTSARTMEIAGRLMDCGINYPKIIDDTYDIKTYTQNRILGKALTASELYLDGTCICSILKRKHLAKYQAEPKDLDGIVSQLRCTTGVETAIFLYPVQNGYKISLRSASYVDVAKIAMEFGGGGHCRAAGAFSEKRPEEIVTQLLAQIEAQMKEHEKLLCTTES